MWPIHKSKNIQQGAALLWGIVLLLVLTIIGVAAARMGVMDTKIVGNEMTSMVTYQASESALNQFRPPVEAIAPEATLSYLKLTIDESTDKKVFVQDAGNTGQPSSTITVNYGQKLPMCNPQEGYAMRIEMKQDSGGYDCNSFIITARSTTPGSGANSTHSMGLMQFTPAR